MKDNISKWYLLPGMGANSSMYDLLRQELDFEINFIDWPKYNGEKAYSEVAKRIIEENDIQDGSICGGSSLGGMVAIEIAKQKKIAAIVLLGSATSSVEVKGRVCKEFCVNGFCDQNSGSLSSNMMLN